MIAIEKMSKNSILIGMHASGQMYCDRLENVPTKLAITIAAKLLIDRKLSCHFGPESKTFFEFGRNEHWCVVLYKSVFGRFIRSNDLTSHLSFERTWFRQLYLTYRKILNSVELLARLSADGDDDGYDSIQKQNQKHQKRIKMHG